MKTKIYSRRIFFLLLGLGCLKLFHAQTLEIDHHKKYWYYKSRFNNDFIKIGLNQGQSIPFNQRGFFIP